MLYNPNQTNDALKTSTEALREVSTIQAVADTGVVEIATATYDTYANTTNADYIHVVSRKTGDKTAIWLDKTSVAEVTTITFPATAGATQADYVNFYNAAGTHWAIWLDIDANGTAPTGALYVASDTQIEVDIATGDSAADVAAKAVAAIGTLTGVSIVDNLDGTVTFTQTTRAACTDAVPKNANDGAAGSIGVSVDTAGVDEVAPTGALYVASDAQIKYSISSGQTAAQIATGVAAAIVTAGNIDGITVSDDTAGVLTFTQNEIGTVANAVSKDENDAGAGSITVAVTQAGTASSLTDKYFTLNSPTAAFYVWINTDSLGSDPAPGGTGIAAVVTTGSTDVASVGATVAAAINANANFQADHEGAGLVQFTNAATGTATDAADGDLGWTISTKTQGQAVVFDATVSPDSLSNSPSVIS